MSIEFFSHSCFLCKSLAIFRFRDNQIISNELNLKLFFFKMIIYLKGSAKSIGISSLSSSGIVASYCTISN